MIPGIFSGALLRLCYWTELWLIWATGLGMGHSLLRERGVIEHLPSASAISSARSFSGGVINGHGCQANRLRRLDDRMQAAQDGRSTAWKRLEPAGGIEHSIC